MDVPYWVMGLMVLVLIALIGVFFWQRSKRNDDD